MSGFFGRVGMGFLVSIPITTIIAGGVENAFGLMLISIICTAGIGLVFWIPVWWIAGWLTLDVLVATIKKVSGDSDDQATPVPARRERPSTAYLALTAYIHKAIASGMDVDEMRRRLQQNGWQTADIESAYQNFISSRSQNAG
jgi:hypothetical protein